jgi:hypothetical protein
MDGDTDDGSHVNSEIHTGDTGDGNYTNMDGDTDDGSHGNSEDPEDDNQTQTTEVNHNKSESEVSPNM